MTDQTRTNNIGTAHIGWVERGIDWVIEITFLDEKL